MAVQLSVAVRNARLNAIETTIGTGAIKRIFTGSMPASCATADSGTMLAQATLPSNWMADAAAGAKEIAGVWADTSADAAGTAGYWRIYDSGVAECGMQGTCSGSGGGGDLVLTNTNIAVGQSITISTFTLTDGNA